MDENQDILVSLILPILNEERYITDCVRSLRKQDLPAERMEILLVDGGSTDGTPELLRLLEAEDPAHIRVLQNPGRIQAAAMNVGARHARGVYLVRIDAHAAYPENYVSTCIRLLEETGAANVGCAVETRARTEKGKVNAMLMTSSFGVGGSQFRVSTQSGFVDTVPFGAFRKAYLLEIGGFDERLVRNEDNEINYRIRKRGDRCYMTGEVRSVYYCRETVGGLANMAFGNGKWTVIASRFCPGSMSLKYFVPLLFVLSLAVMPVLSALWWGFRWLFVLELGLYLALALFFALQKTRRVGQLLRLTALFPVFHVCYGAGSICGIWALLRNKMD